MTEVSSSGKDTINTNNSVVRINKGSDNFMFFDGAIYRMIVGLDQNNEPIIKISKPGFSVLDAADDELIFNSSQNVFKIVQSGTVSVTKAANVTTQSTSVGHSLGYPPIVVAYINDSTINTPLPYTVFSLGGATAGFLQLQIYYQTSISDIAFFVNAPTNSPFYSTVAGANVTYYILQESAN